MNQKTEQQERTPVRAIAVGVETPGEDTAASIEELARLIDTAGAECFAVITQSQEAANARTRIGKGKLAELKEACEGNGIGLVVFDGELTPSQIRNIEDALDGPDVIDRSMLILDIFAGRARTKEGKLQVELAQLQYTAPRLTGKGKDLSRQEGRIGSRGPGESKLESDKRHIHRRMQALREELAAVEKNRAVVRAAREKSGIPKAAIAGYTNAGKSTLMNALCGAGILAEDKLFATLDPTTRKFVLPDGREMLLTDTVGFIRSLPHQLISAFRSTLEEVRYADFVVVVIDASDPEAPSQTAVTEDLLAELCEPGRPRLYVFNKIDRAEKPYLPEDDPHRGLFYVAVSALTGENLDLLAEKLQEVSRLGSRKITLYFPHSAMSDLNRLYRVCTVESAEADENGISVSLYADEKTAGMFSRYRIGEKNE